MSKIQLDSSRSSSATHRLTQASTTLNRRYVRRPDNIAIEEAAREAAQHVEEEPVQTAPSRLVNLSVRSADLAAAQAAEEAAKQQQMSTENTYVRPVTTIPHVVEFGGLYSEPTTDCSTTTSPMAVTENSVNNVPAPEPMTAASQTMSQVPAPTPEIDTATLAMNIAADYAAASLGASVKEYGNNYNNYALNNPDNTSDETANTQAVPAPTSTPDSIDAIAQAASEAIASIRVATEPSQVSEQVASLKAFADNIKSNPSMPEMKELGDTIDKFVSIAMKSSKVQAENAEKAATKVTLSPKVNRAAAKVTKSSAKVMAATNRARGTNQVHARPNVKSPRNCHATSMAPRRSSPQELKERAIEQALHSVATMDEEYTPKTRRQPAMRTKRKGGVKRFAIAFACATLCVGGIIGFVSANIPDISVRVAAMQTGITAAYPSYIPRDYNLGDIYSEDGKITMVFNGPNNASFTLIEEKSSWDSSALLRNYVEPVWGEDYVTTHEQGITIYISESTSDTAWVNGGVLYRITSEGTPLTKKQVRSIVTSL